MRASENACVIYGGDKRRGKRDGHCVGDGRCKTNFCRILSPITQSLLSSSLNNTRPSTQPMKVIMCNTFESLTRDGPRQPELGNKEGTKLCLQPPQAGPIFVYISIQIFGWSAASSRRSNIVDIWFIVYISKGLLL